jgi:hypothetical protein
MSVFALALAGVLIVYEVGCERREDCAAYSPDDFAHEAAEALCDHMRNCPADAEALGYPSLKGDDCSNAARGFYSRAVEAAEGIDCDQFSQCGAVDCVDQMRNASDDCGNLLQCIERGNAYEWTCSGDTG